MYHNIQTSAGGTVHGTEVETDRNYKEVKHTVETPLTMEHNMAYSTTMSTTYYYYYYYYTHITSNDTDKEHACMCSIHGHNLMCGDFQM